MARNGSTKNEGTTQQQKLFAYAYFNNKGNGTKAAIEAGYSPRSAAEQASYLLNNPKVKAILKKLNDQLETKAIITKERVIEEYARIGLFDLRTLYDAKGCLKSVSSLNEAAGAALQGLEVEELYSVVKGKRVKTGTVAKIKLHSKIAALDGITEIFGWKTPAKISQTDLAGNDFTQLPIYLSLPPGLNIDLPSNTESDDPSDLHGFNGKM